MTSYLLIVVMVTTNLHLLHKCVQTQGHWGNQVKLHAILIFPFETVLDSQSKYCYTEGTGREAPRRGARTADKATNVDGGEWVLIGNVSCILNPCAPSCHSILPLIMSRYGQSRFLDSLYTILLTDIFKYLQQPKPTLSVRESYCAAVYIQTMKEQSQMRTRYKRMETAE